jgi:hypothetical protein
MTSPAYEFLDGRGEWTEHGNLDASGAIVARRKGGEVLELIDLHGNNRTAFSAPSGGTLIADDPEGKHLGNVDFTAPREGRVEFKPAPGARAYLYSK